MNDNNNDQYLVHNEQWTTITMHNEVERTTLTNRQCTKAIKIQCIKAIKILWQQRTI